MIKRFLIFGATGDLTSRLLMPSLAALIETGDVPSDLAVVGVGIESHTTEVFRTRIGAALDEHASSVSRAARDRLLGAITYRQGDATDAAAVAAAVQAAAGPVVAYLALPPTVFHAAIEALGAAGLPAGSIVAIEKPFGTDLASAQALNRLLHDVMPNVTVFRNDHFLHHLTVQRLLALRFANRIFEPIWNRDHIERVDITWDETLTLEGRASYYDRSGALKDMIQNHLLQIMCLVAMEPPARLHEKDLRNSKFAVLRAVPEPMAAEVPAMAQRGRYVVGTIGGRDVPNYVDEAGVDEWRRTETFAQLRLEVANWRWAGVPFTLRSGKALERDRAEVVVTFRDVPPTAHAPRELLGSVNQLRLDLKSAHMELWLNVNGRDNRIEPIALVAKPPPANLPAYARLVRDMVRGDPMLAIRGDEAEESWRIVQPVLDAFVADRVPLVDYPAGSAGLWTS